MKAIAQTKLEVTFSASPGAFTVHTGRPNSNRTITMRNSKTGRFAFTTRKGAEAAVKRAFGNDYELIFTN